LAAAYAESGDFPNAISWQEKATELAPKSYKRYYVEELELYRLNKPRHDLGKPTK
jgi:hypothetical protein